MCMRLYTYVCVCVCTRTPPPLSLCVCVFVKYANYLILLCARAQNFYIVF